MPTAWFKCSQTRKKPWHFKAKKRPKCVVFPPLKHLINLRFNWLMFDFFTSISNCIDAFSSCLISFVLKNHNSVLLNMHSMVTAEKSTTRFKLYWYINYILKTSNTSGKTINNFSSNQQYYKSNVVAINRAKQFTIVL